MESFTGKSVLDAPYTARDKAVLAVKGVVSLLPQLGLIKKPRFHPNGISFIVAVKDEQRWIKPCIQSIQHLADEIIVVDSSVLDSTTQIIQELKASNPKIKHILFYCDSPSAFALSLTLGFLTSITNGSSNGKAT